MGNARFLTASDLMSPDPLEILNRLSLSTGKAAHLCGVTRRQLGYWLAQGALGDAAPASGRRARFGGASIARVLALKQIRDQGRGVRRAKSVVQQGAQRQSTPSSEWSHAQRLEYLAQQAERMEQICARIRLLAVNGKTAGGDFRRTTPISRREPDGGNGNGREAQMAELAGWLMVARQGWARELPDGAAAGTNEERCRRMGLFLDLLDCNLAAARVARQAGEGGGRQ